MGDYLGAEGHNDLPVVSCRHLTKVWDEDGPARTVAIEGLNLQVRVGEVVALLGPSGCGKSTLLRVIAGLDPPSSGVVEAWGKRVTGPAPECAMVFQEPGLYPWLTVWENVSFGLGLKGEGRATRRAAAYEALEQVGLADLADRLPGALSQGMRQRVAIARALVMRPGLLLLDEPFAALDVQTRKRMRKFLLIAADRSRGAVLLVTHDIDEALEIADRLIVLTSRPGRIKLDITLGQTAYDPSSQDARRAIESAISEEVDRAFVDQERAAHGSPRSIR